MSDGMASGAEPEVALLKRVCRYELKTAVASALDGLGPADRLLLR
jgi:hypothetical protein